MVMKFGLVSITLALCLFNIYAAPVSFKEQGFSPGKRDGAGGIIEVTGDNVHEANNKRDGPLDDMRDAARNVLCASALKKRDGAGDDAGSILDAIGPNKRDDIDGIQDSVGDIVESSGEDNTDVPGILDGVRNIVDATD